MLEHNYPFSPPSTHAVPIITTHAPAAGVFYSPYAQLQEVCLPRTWSPLQRADGLPLRGEGTKRHPYIFCERGIVSYISSLLAWANSLFLQARSARRRLGRTCGTLACMARWAWPRSCCTTSPTLGERPANVVSSVCLCQVLSIHSWALKEAKARMEARGEKA